MTRASIVIPAHNEGAVIERCLDALRLLDAHVVVVANGCADDTVQRARRYDVQVIEVPEASKVGALNVGDASCGELFPRIYLDADVVLSADDALKLAAHLNSTGAARVCAAAPDYDLDGCPWPVRSFYRVFRKLPYLTEGMVGAGCYAVNDAGRARWGQFPRIIADDLFVQGRFERAERTVVPGTRFLVTAPRTLTGLLRIRTRTYRGNAEASQVQQAGSMSGSRAGSLRAVSRLAQDEPRMLGAIMVYLAINVVAAGRARWGRRSSWLTDESSREHAAQK